MTAYARSLCSGATFFDGDFTQRRRSAERYDLVVCLLGTLSHLQTNRELQAAYAAVSETMLSATGALIVELAHPRFFFNGSLSAAARQTSDDEWEVPIWHSEDEHMRLTVQWGEPGDRFDALQSCLYRTVTVSILEKALPSPRRCLRDVVPTRLFTVPELQLYAEGAGLRVAAMYGGLCWDAADAPDADRLVLVMTRA
jgi:hypothetical protein